MSSFPQLFALKKEYSPHVKKYMSYVTEDSRRGCIEFSSEAGALSTTTNFAVDHARNGLVHIRSCYNNKYLCRKSPESRIVAAAANEPVENMSEWNCTLFRPRWSNDGLSLSVSFFHMGIDDEGYTVMENNDNVWEIQKFVGGLDTLVLVDTGSKVRLPKRVTFKGDNGKYLCAQPQDELPYNQFICDNNSEVAQYEIFVTRDGDIRVKSLHFGKFWRRSSDDWIWADSDDNTSDNLDTLFEAVKVGENTIALRNRKNNKFCIRLADRDWKFNSLNAAETTVVPEARLIVEEPVFERTVKVQFRFQDAKIYDRKVIQAASATVSNVTNRDHELTHGFSYTKTHIGTWNTTTSIKVGTKATVKSGIPGFAEAGFEMSGEISEEVSCGESKDFSQQLNSSYKVPVPAMTKVTVKLLASKATYDIPYAYYQIDSYTTGESVSTFLDDGIYHGVEAFDFNYEPKYEPIQSHELHLLKSQQP